MVLVWRGRDEEVLDGVGDEEESVRLPVLGTNTIQQNSQQQRVMGCQVKFKKTIVG